MLEESIEAGPTDASHEHRSRIIVTMRRSVRRQAAAGRTTSVGATPAPASLWCCGCLGPLAGHADSAVIPFLLPDIPVWWRGAHQTGGAKAQSAGR